MIETRPRKAVAGSVDPGKPEASHINAAAVTARGYKLVADPSRLLQFALGND